MKIERKFPKRYLALSLIPLLWALSKTSQEEYQETAEDEAVSKIERREPQRKIASTLSKDFIKNSLDRSPVEKFAPENNVPEEIADEVDQEEKSTLSSANSYVHSPVKPVKAKTPALARVQAASPSYSDQRDNAPRSPEASPDFSESSNPYGNSTYIHNVTNPGQGLGNSSEPVDPNQLNCTSTVPSGTYAYSLAVNISCSSAADIRYCIGENACCDPDSDQGQTYSAASPLIIGKSNSNFCLSYYAVGSSGQTSPMASNRYLINRQAPDLEVNRSIIQAQTTEPHLNSYVSSNDFGKNNISISQISFFTHNIGDSGDQLACSELQAQMTSYASPHPHYTLSPELIAGRSLGDEIIVPLRPLQSLDYGINYIATLITDFNGATPNYACSVSTFTLWDFSIFDESPISSSGELTAGFSSFGFFEEDLIVRAPAGESSSTVSQQKMETSFLSILY